MGRLLNLFLGVFVTVLVVRALGDTGFGSWSGILAVVTLTGSLCDLGLRQVAVRHAAAEPESEQEVIGALFQLRLMLSTAAFMVSVIAVAAISTDKEMFAAGVLLCLTLLFAAPGAFTTFFQLRVRNDLMIVAMTVQSIVWAIAVAVVFMMDGGLVALAIGFLFSTLANNVVIVWLARRHGRIRLRGARRHWGHLTRVGVPIALGSILILGYGRIDQILVLVLAGSSDAGQYAAVYRIFDQSQFVAISVSTSMFAVLAASFANDQERFRRFLQATVEVMVAFSVAGLVFSIAYAKPLVVLLFGADFAPAAPALTILMVTLVLVSLGYVVGSLVIITERQQAFVLVCVVGLVFNVGLNLILIPIGGFMAAAWITLGTEVVVLSLAWLVVRGRLAAGVATGRFVRIGLAAGAQLVLLLALRQIGVPVVPALVVLAVGYPTVLIAFRAISIAEIRSMRVTARTEPVS